MMYVKRKWPVNTKNDEKMVVLGLRQPKLEINKEIFKKTEEEKSLLKTMKKTCVPMKGITGKSFRKLKYVNLF